MADRRAFFLSSAAMAAAATLTPESSAAAPTLGNLSKALDAQDLPSFRREMLDSLPDTDANLKGWASAFSVSLDEHATQAVRTAGQKWLDETSSTQSPYDPLLIEENLSVASSLLDEALGYRRELAMLDVEGFGLMLRYSQELHLIASTGSTVAAGSQRKSAAALASGYQYAADAPTLDVLDKRRTIADAEAAKAFSEREALRESVAARQLEVMRASTKALRLQMIHPGGGSNFAERYRRILPYFLETIAEAYQRCYAAMLGFRHLYGKAKLHELRLFTLSHKHEDVHKWTLKELQLSDYRKGAYGNVQIASGDVADALVAWCRHTIARLEEAGRNEIEYTVLVPLRQPALMQGTARQPLLSSFAAVLEPTGAGATFDIPLSLFTEDFEKESVIVERLRMTGLGVQLSLTDEALEKKAPVFSASVRANPPVIEGMTGFRRPPAVFGRVEATQHGRQGPSLLEANVEVHNLNPVTNWTVRIRPRATFTHNTDVAAIAKSVLISEIVLAIRVRALVRSV